MLNLIFIFLKEIFNTPVRQLMHALAVARKGHPRMTKFCFSRFRSDSSILALANLPLCVGKGGAHKPLAPAQV
jgi:hypothetical protein